MRRTALLQEIRKMRFEEAYAAWNEGRLTQSEAGMLLGVGERSFRRYLVRYEDDRLDGLIDRRLEQMGHHRAPVDEVMALTEQYQSRHSGWNVKRFHSWYKREGGERSYSWVKKQLQEAQLVPKAAKKGAHRKRRERSALPGMMIHQDGSTHEWITGQQWDLISTMDDATREHYSLLFVDEEGTASSFRGVVTSLKPAACSVRSIATGEATTGTPRKPAAKSTRPTPPNSDAPWPIWASK